MQLAVWIAKQVAPVLLIYVLPSLLAAALRRSFQRTELQASLFGTGLISALIAYTVMCMRGLVRPKSDFFGIAATCTWLVVWMAMFYVLFQTWYAMRSPQRISRVVALGFCTGFPWMYLGWWIGVTTGTFPPD